MAGRSITLRHWQGTRQKRGNLARVPSRLASALFICILNMASAPANADVLSDVSGIVTDPFKLGRASDDILQSVNQINAVLRELEGRTNQDLRDRVAEVQRLVDDMISAVDRNREDIKEFIRTTQTQINQLEVTIVRDAEQLLNKFHCTVRAVLDQDLETGLAKIIDQLRKANPALTLFGIPIMKITVQQIKSKDPFDAYLQTKAALFAEYQKIGANDGAYKIPQIFGNIADLAYWTRCEDTANNKPAIDQILLRDEIEYKRLQEPWTSILTPYS